MSAINARIPYITALLLGLAMIATLGWQAYQIWASDWQNGTAPARQSATTPTLVDGSPTIELSQVALFGTADTDIAEEAANTEGLPKTNLRLSLRGVLAAEGDFPGSALIEDDKGNTEVYLVGNELPGNASLHSVHSHRVVIDRSGKLENLFFPEEDNDNSMTVSAIQQQREEGLVADEHPQSATPATIQRPQTPAANEQRREEVRQRLEELRQRLKANSN